MDKTSITQCLVSDEEVWKPVPEWEGYYEVSNLGRARSLDRTFDKITSGITRTVHLKGRVLRPGMTTVGYFQYVFSANGKRKNMPMHRMVLEAFVGSCPEGMLCCHNDGNPLNNRLDNLRWDTQTANMADCIKHGYSQFGSKNNSSILTEKDVIDIKRRLKNGKKGIGRRLAKEYSVHFSNISAISVGRNWAWLNPDDPTTYNLTQPHH